MFKHPGILCCLLLLLLATSSCRTEGNLLLSRKVARRPAGNRPGESAAALQAREDGSMPATIAYKGQRINYLLCYTSSTTTTYNPQAGGGSHMHTSNSRSTHHYIQQGGNSKAVRFRYCNLRRMIPQSDPASIYLDRYIKQKRAFNGVRWAGWAV